MVEQDIARELDPDRPGEYKIGNFTWSGTGGYNRSGAWTLELYDYPGQDSTGWGIHSNSFAAGEKTHIYISHLLKVSGNFVVKMQSFNLSGAEIGVKWLDGIYGYDAAGNTDNRRLRQTSFLRVLSTDPRPTENPIGGLGWVLVTGGAGVQYGMFPSEIEPLFRNAGNYFNLANYVGQWVYLVFEFDYVNHVSALHIVTEDGQFTSPGGSTPYLRRTEFPDPNFEYGNSYFQSNIAGGYWNTSNLTYAPDISLTIDNLVISDTWVDPPFL